VNEELAADFVTDGADGGRPYPLHAKRLCEAIRCQDIVTRSLTEESRIDMKKTIRAPPKHLI
jgi:hypothetical protein